MDHWGFFNGAVNNTLLSSGQNLMQYYPVCDDFKWYQGAHREGDELKNQAGVLTEIRYPTKGSVKFTYESNRFTNTINGSQMVTKDATDFNAVPTDFNAIYNKPLSDEFTINAQQVDINYNMHYKSTLNPPNCYMGTGKDNCMWVAIEKKSGTSWVTQQNWYLSGPSPSVTQNVKVSLTAGTYRLQAHYPDDYVGTFIAGTTPDYASVNVTYSVVAETTKTLFGGGLRIARIEYVDPVESKSWAKRYTYSGGVNLNLPVYTHVGDPNFTQISCGTLNSCCPQDDNDPQTLPCYSITTNRVATMYSDNIIRHSNSANGSPVGYSFVSVEFEGGGNGKTNYSFRARNAGVQAEYTLPGIPTENILDNGFLLKQIDFKYENNQYVITREVENVPNTYNRLLLWGFKTERRIPYLSCPSSSGGRSISSYPCASCEQFVLHFYPIRYGNVATSTTYERTYSGSTIMETVSTKDYNARGYLSKEQITNSDDKIYLTEYKYPTDYTTTSGFLFDLQQKNIINAPIEVLKKVNGNVVEGTFLAYKTANNLTTPNTVYKIETATPKAITSSAPTGTLPSDFKPEGTVEYNANGNISYTQATNDVVTGYIWGYNNSLPVAVIKNAMPSQVFYTSFEESTTYTSPTARTGTKGYTEAYTVNLPAAGTYKLTYWKKTGLTAWEYVEEVITAAKIIGGTGIIIDEVRVYPSTAQVTTYTYNALLGVTSSTDPDGVTTYYDYDTYGRLKLVRDQNNKIVKQYKYHYKEF